MLDPTGLSMNIGDEFLGLYLRAATPQGAVDLRVVGLARSVTGTANAWATPATVARLAGGRGGFQMLYRFAHAAAPAQLAADGAAVEAAVPQGAVTGASSYLSIRQQLTANAAAFTPFVIAFGVLAIILSVLVIGIVVSGTVGAARRRIGIVKAIGFTPWQVTRSYLRQTLIPVLAAVIAGAAAAMALSRPVLSGIDAAYGGQAATIPWWAVATVGCGMIALVALAAALPALRMARVPAATLLRGGRRGSPSHFGGRVQRAIGVLPLPRPFSLGLAAPLRRPSRSLAMAAAVLTGTACLSFAIGLLSSLGAVQHSRNPLTGAAVQVGPSFPETPTADSVPHEPVISDPGAVARAIAAMPQTRSAFAVTDATVGVTGLVGGVDVAALSGDSSFTAHQMVAGHWLSGAGQVVLPTRALAETGKSVGGQITLTRAGRSATVTVVGEVFDLTHGGQRFYTDTSTLTALGIAAAPQQFFVDLRPGTDVTAYQDALSSRIAPYGAQADAAGDGSSSVIVAMNAITALLAVMLLAVAGIGVFAAVTLETRERIRDIGVLKSLGMTPWQTVTMTLTSACATGLLAGTVGVPLGIAVHHAVAPAMGATAGAVLTPSQTLVYTAPMVALLLVGGLILVSLAAAGPAGWAARAHSAAALRTE